MAGKWAIVDSTGKPIGKPTEFPPSELKEKERVTFKMVMYASEARGPIIEVFDPANKQNRATATRASALATWEVTVSVIADSPFTALTLLDEVLDKVGVRSAFESEKLAAR